MYYAEKMRVLAQINNDKSQKAGSLINKRLFLLYSNRYFEAEINLDKALVIYEEIKDDCKIASTYNMLGGTYSESGNQAEAFNAFQKALKHYKTCDDLEGIIYTNMNIGTLFLEYDEIRKSLVYYKSAWNLAQKDDNNIVDGNLLHNMGIAYANLEINDSAYYFYLQSIKRFYETDDLIRVCKSYVNLGILFANNIQCPDSGMYYYQKALEIAKEVNEEKVISTVYLNMGELYLSKNDTIMALRQYEEALKIAIDINNPKQQEVILYSIYILYKEKGDYKHSLSYFEEYIAIHDSLSNDKTNIAISKLEAQHELENKKHEIMVLNSKRDLEKFVFAIIVFVFVIVIFVLALFIKFHIGLKKTEKHKFFLEKQLIKANNDAEIFKQQELKKNIEYKSRQLTSHALNMMQKNQHLSAISDLLVDLRKGVSEEYQGILRKLSNTINQGINADKDWDVFRIYYDDTNKGFFENLKKVAPNLSVNEQRLCVLVMLKLNIKETASILNLSPNSIKSARYKLRKKLNLKTQDDLFDVLDGI